MCDVREWVMVWLLKILTVLSFVSLCCFCTWGMIANSWGSFAHYVVSVYLGEYSLLFDVTCFWFWLIILFYRIFSFSCSSMIIMSLIARFLVSDSCHGWIMIILVKKWLLFVLRLCVVGGYDKEDKAARAYDLAALKYWGPTTTTNFPVRIFLSFHKSTIIFIVSIILNSHL